MKFFKVLAQHYVALQNDSLRNVSDAKRYPHGSRTVVVTIHK